MMGIQGILKFGALTNNAAVNILVHISLCNHGFISVV